VTASAVGGMIDNAGSPEAGGAEGIGFRCHDVSRRFAARGEEVAALDSVTFAIRALEFVCIVGPSGCGKSTLLRIIGGLLAPTSGKVLFDGAAAGDRPRTGLVFQEHGTFPWMTVLDNVAFGLEMSGMPRAERRERAMAFVERVGLASFARHYPHELSVGMRQRVGVARAFVSGAPILLMDEPFGSLDAQTKWVLQAELLRVWQEDRKLVVFVTHDIEEAVLLADRVLVMTGRPGRIREELHVPLGRPRDLPRDQERVSELTWHIWRLLEEEVRDGLSIRS
jgi:NitT/TauT family transport system ATP-binding protein